MGHARALISVDTVDRQLYIYHQIISQQLSVRQTEALVRKVSHGDRQKITPAKKATLPPAYRKIEDRLSSHFSTRVKLNRQSNGKGNIVIEFYSDEELNQILGSLER
jgi:ParB family chromosome partitioning protein